MTLDGWQLPSGWAGTLLAVLSRVKLHSTAAEGFLLHLGGNEALTTQAQICYLESRTSLSVTQPAVLNTLQLVFEWVKRGVTNLRPRRHGQGMNSSNPCPWHGCPTPAVLVWAVGNADIPGLAGDEAAGAVAASVSQLSRAQLCVPHQLHNAPTLWGVSQVLLPPAAHVPWLAAFLVFGCSGHKVWA